MKRKQISDRSRLRCELDQMRAFWAGVGHDVGNLLEAVVANAEDLRHHLREDPASRRLLEAILTAGELAGRCVREAVRSEHNSCTGLNDLLRRSESFVRVLAGDDIQVELRFAPREVFVAANPIHTARIVLNLVVNAREAMPQGGRLTIGVDERVRARITMCSPRRDRHWGCVMVCDTGTGIADASPIFDAGYTTKREHLGIGLATVQWLVEQNGGYIECESEVGRGTTFSVFFPRRRAGSGKRSAKLMPVQARTARPRNGTRSAMSHAELSDSWDRETRRILVVDDDPAVREILCWALSTSGYRVLAAASAAEALDRYEREARQLDLLITDIRMERFTGIELAAAMRARHPRLRILYISGYAEEARSSGRGNADYLMKPFTPSTLISKVHDLLP